MALDESKRGDPNSEGFLAARRALNAALEQAREGRAVGALELALEAVELLTALAQSERQEDPHAH